MDVKGRKRLAGVAWVGGALLALGWSALDVGPVQARGVGFAPRLVISADEVGRLARVEVALHDEVRAGMVVARLDSSSLVAEREVLNAELLMEQEAQALAVAGEARRMAEGVEGALLDRARVSAALQEDRASRVALMRDLETERGLAARGATSAQAVRDLERDLAVLDAGIAAREQLLTMASQAADAALGGREVNPRENAWAIVAASRRLEAVEQRIAKMDLKAGIDGQVTWIYAAPGEVVSPGTPIMEVTYTGTSEVVAWVSAGDAAGLEAGEGATVTRDSGQTLSGRLQSVGSGPRELPVALWADPGWPEYGVPVRIQLDDGEVAPDEALTVRL